MPGTLTMLISGGVAAVVMIAAGWFLPAMRRRQRWERAWATVERSPSAALDTFDRMIVERTWGSDATWLSRCHMGRAVCLVRLKRMDEAAAAQGAARALAPPSREDQNRLIEAYLSLPGEELSGAAVVELAGVLVQSDTAVDPATRQRIEGLIRSVLALAPDAEPERVRRVLELSRQLVAVAPGLWWIHASLGDASRRVEQWQGAAESYRRAIELAPDHGELHLALGRAYRQMGDLRQARAAFQRAYALAPDAVTSFEAAMVCLALHDESLGSAESRELGEKSPLGQAMELLQESIRRDAGYAPAWMGLGQVQWRMGQREEGIESLERSLQIDPRLAGAHSALGQCWLELGDRDKAQRALARALELDPASPQAARLAGDVAYEAGDFVAAAGCYRGLDAKQVSDPAVADRMARSFLEANEPRRAIELLGGRGEYDAAARLTLGRSQARVGQWKEALETLQAIDVATASNEYRYYTACALAANGRLRDAEVILRTLLSDEAWRARTRRQLGHIHAMSGDWDGAARFYTMADGDAESTFDLGRLRLLQNDWPAAHAAFQKAGAQNGKSLLARFGAAIAGARMGEPESLAELLHDSELSHAAAEQLANQYYESSRFVDAMALYERIVRERQSVSTAMLGRLTMGYLQLGQYRQALPHLVELARRRPQLKSVQHNLALCRYHLGRAHFKQSQWEMARLEWSRAREIARSIDSPQGDALMPWELEAAYREGSRLLTQFHDRPGELKRAVRLFEYGAEQRPAEPRWAFGAGLAHAFRGDFARSAEYFARAWKLAPDRVGFTLGCGLSLEAAQRGAPARAAMQKALQLCESDSEARSSVVPVATRFALAMSYARDHEWERAATELEPLLEHPLIRSSSRIKPSDVAQAMVAYYGLAGQKDRAGQVAAKYLKQVGGVGDIVLGLVQAEAGDYAGAADTLERAYHESPTPALHTVLINVLLAAAADSILKEKTDKALEFVGRVLRLDASHADARALRDALNFGKRMGKLDLAHLDRAIAQCESMLERDSSPQLIRTVAILYHRRAMAGEIRGAGNDQQWRQCIEFWRKHILKNNAFWAQFATSYNVGKGRREQVKTDEVTKWRKELPGDEHLAEAHTKLVSAHLNNSDTAGVRRNLALIWQWDPDFKPPDSFLQTELLTMSESMIEIVGDALEQIGNQEVRQKIAGVLAKYWANKAAEALGPLIQAARLGPIGMAMMRDQILDGLRRARRLMERAHELDPHDAEISQALDNVRDACNKAGV